MSNDPDIVPLYVGQNINAPGLTGLSMAAEYGLVITVYGNKIPMQQVEFQLRGEFVELNQLLKLTGVCDSGGAGKALVTAGVVSVDGKVELRKTCKVRAGSVVSLGEVQIRVIA